jgi:lysophospholipase
MATAAPYFAPLADGPAEARAAWLTAKDGARIRAVHWPLVGAKGTVILMPGRTEYIEKYGRAAADLARRGYACICVDWRGQGLAVRSVADPMTGHVGDFDEFQRDVDALLAWARTEGAVEPLFLIGHSMGGCIGLRALTRELPFQAAAFSAPMWGISMAAWMRPLAPLIAQLSIWAGRAHAYAPTTGGKTYLLSVPFQGNVLTSDAAMWEYMRRQVAASPELALGGPSVAWLHAALRECAALAAMPSPTLPCVTALGTAEKVVDPAPIHLQMARWPKGRLDLYPMAEHEVMMETPAHRARFFDSACALFDAHR